MSEDCVSTKKGGIAPKNIEIPEYTDNRFISSVEYWRKYRHLLPQVFTDRDIAPACRRWHKKEDLPLEERTGLISEKRLVQDTAALKPDGTYQKTKLTRWQWFVLDLPPEEHPGWAKYHDNVLANMGRAGKKITKKFKEMAPIFLERFNNYLIKVDHTRFRVNELAKAIGTTSYVIRRWTELGVEGFGKLPCIKADDAIKPLIEDGVYRTKKVKAGRIDYYYETKDIKRFFKGELADLSKKFNTIDDKVTLTNIDKIAEESGYWVYYPEKVAPLSYQGFISWVKKNIVIYDKRIRRIQPFNPSPKQIEFYQNAFALKSEGLLKHNFIYTCRPRGEFKTFDVALIVLFRFFNLPYEKIYLVTNSVQQTVHLVYREINELIKRSPTLREYRNKPALDIQKDGIYLRAGKGLENIFSSIEIVSAEGGARSNATCIAWSEAWKFRGNDSDVAELMQSIRGVDNAMFLAESTVAPKGHWFQRQYEMSITEPDPITYFQYYSGEERQNPRVTVEFLNNAKKSFPIHYKMFFDNKWEDATVGLFKPEYIIEMGCLGIDGGFSRNTELLNVIKRIVDLKTEIRKYDNTFDLSPQKTELRLLESRLHKIKYKIPMSIDELLKLSEIYNCDWVLGIGLDRAKQLNERADRTFLAMVARGILDPNKWGIDRIYFLVDLVFLKREDNIIEFIDKMVHSFDDTHVYIDLEDYNVLDLYNKCIERGYDVQIASTTIKHQKDIFAEFHLALEEGYFKAPELDIWFDEQNIIHISEPIPIGRQDILREEMAAFEYCEGSSDNNKRQTAKFGSSYKIKTGRTGLGEPKDDTVYAVAHAIHASMRGSVPISLLKNEFAFADINNDVFGDYREVFYQQL